MSRAWLLALVAAAGVVVAACGGGGASGSGDGAAQSVSCPNDLPSSCPVPTPSYASDVEPILAERCVLCHESGGLEVAPFDLGTYTEVFTERSAVLDQVYSCAMPLVDSKGAQPLSESERTTLLAWLVCGAPQN